MAEKVKWKIREKRGPKGKGIYQKKSFGLLIWILTLLALNICLRGVEWLFGNGRMEDGIKDLNLYLGCLFSSWEKKHEFLL